MAWFAEGKNHEEIVPQCLSSGEMENKVVTFLEKSGFAGETEAARADRVKGVSLWKAVANGPTVPGKVLMSLVQVTNKGQIAVFCLGRLLRPC